MADRHHARPGRTKLKDGEIFGYGVDAGLGSFMDHEAVRAMRWRGRETKCDNYYDCVLADELAANNDDYAMHLPMKDEDANVAVFSSGWGDGFYATYWGEDESGQALALVTDFGVLEDGDGRTLQQRRVAAMSPEQREAAGRAHAAIQRDDEAALRAVLIEGVATPEAFAPETGETLTLEAVRGDKPKALETLIRYGARREGRRRDRARLRAPHLCGLCRLSGEADRGPERAATEAFGRAQGRARALGRGRDRACLRRSRLRPSRGREADALNPI
nr:DUF4241 domain-containing protein [Chenggangzhangella methanolivorans]